MRGLRSTIALTVVLAGLGAYIYFVTWRQPDDATAVDKVFAALESDNVTSITVKQQAGDATTVQKTDGSWRMTAPLAGGADPVTTTAITQALSTLERERTIDETGEQADQYGLVPPGVDVDFTTNDGTSHRLALGDATPTGASLYARRDDEPAVFLVPQYQKAAFDKSTFDLRDKSIATFARDSIVGLTVRADGHTVELRKAADSPWRLTEPVDARADVGVVEGVVSRLQTSQMKAVITDDAPSQADLRTYGLDRPSVAASIDVGATPITVELGGQAADGTIYARSSARPGVFTVENALADQLGRGPDEYRRHDLFEFRAYNATRVALTRGDGTVTFERVKAEGDEAGDTWRRTTPGPATDADKTDVEALLGKIADLRADSFANSTAGTGLATPMLTAHVTFNDEGDEEQVTFGRSGDATYAAVPGDAGAARIDTSALDEILAALDDLAG